MELCQETQRVRGRMQVCIADHSETSRHQWVEPQSYNGLVYYRAHDPLITGIINALIITGAVAMIAAIGIIILYKWSQGDI